MQRRRGRQSAYVFATQEHRLRRPRTCRLKLSEQVVQAGFGDPRPKLTNHPLSTNLVCIGAKLIPIIGRAEQSKPNHARAWSGKPDDAHVDAPLYAAPQRLHRSQPADTNPLSRRFSTRGAFGSGLANTPP